MTSNITISLIFEPLTQKYTKTNVFQSLKHKTETKTNHIFQKCEKEHNFPYLFKLKATNRMFSRGATITK